MAKITIKNTIDYDIDFYDGKFEIHVYNEDTDEIDVQKLTLNDFKYNFMHMFVSGNPNGDYVLPDNEGSKNLIKDIKKLKDFFTDLHEEALVNKTY